MPHQKGPVESPKPAAEAAGESTRASLAGLKGTLAELGVKPETAERLTGTFENFGKAFDKLVEFLDKIFGGAILRQEARALDPEKPEERAKIDEDLRRRGLDPAKLDNYGKKIHAIWRPEDPKNVMGWFCSITTIPKGANKGNPDTILVDTNNCQSFGKFQLNGIGHLGRFLAYARDAGAAHDVDYFAGLSEGVRAKALRLAGREQKPNDLSLYFTRREGIELLQKVFVAYPELELNYRGREFFERELASTLERMKKKFPQKTSLLNRLMQDERYLAVMLDVINQGGPGGGRRTLRYVLSSASENPSHAELLRLFVAGSRTMRFKMLSPEEERSYQTRRAMRTFHVFVEASGRETGFRYRDVERAMTRFMSVPENQQEQILAEYEKKRASGEKIV